MNNLKRQHISHIIGNNILQLLFSGSFLCPNHILYKFFELNQQNLNPHNLFIDLVGRFILPTNIIFPHGLSKEIVIEVGWVHSLLSGVGWVDKLFDLRGEDFSGLGVNFQLGLFLDTVLDEGFD